MSDNTNLDISILERAVAGFDFVLTDTQKQSFLTYYQLLIEWNSFMNLTAITDFEEVCMKHFADSLSLCQAIDCTKPMKVIDLSLIHIQVYAKYGVSPSGSCVQLLIQMPILFALYRVIYSMPDVYKRQPQINSIPIEDGEENVIPGFRFMGQRFSIDAMVMQKLIYSNVQSNSRCV